MPCLFRIVANWVYFFYFKLIYASRGSYNLSDNVKQYLQNCLSETCHCKSPVTRCEIELLHLNCMDILFLCSHNISQFYLPDSGDYICSLPQDGGMQNCSGILQHCLTQPPQPPSGNSSGSSNCSDIAKYYTTCQKKGPNPYYDNMSFDNIAMAWIFIYQVRFYLAP